MALLILISVKHSFPLQSCCNNILYYIRRSCRDFRTTCLLQREDLHALAESHFSSFDYSPGNEVRSFGSRWDPWKQKDVWTQYNFQTKTSTVMGLVSELRPQHSKKLSMYSFIEVYFNFSIYGQIWFRTLTIKLQHQVQSHSQLQKLLDLSQIRINFDFKKELTQIRIDIRLVQSQPQGLLNIQVMHTAQFEFNVSLQSQSQTSELWPSESEVGFQRSQ